MAGFPLNDGGMFLVMLRELKSNHFLIPAFTSYNYSNIPFAYPPFGFYAGAFLNVLGIPDIEILRWLPVIVDVLTIPGFFPARRNIIGRSSARRLGNRLLCAGSRLRLGNHGRRLNAFFRRFVHAAGALFFVAVL